MNSVISVGLLRMSLAFMSWVWCGPSGWVLRAMLQSHSDLSFAEIECMEKPYSTGRFRPYRTVAVLPLPRSCTYGWSAPYYIRDKRGLTRTYTSEVSLSTVSLWRNRTVQVGS